MGYVFFILYYIEVLWGMVCVGVGFLGFKDLEVGEEELFVCSFIVV